jgi:hypothetical protein
LFVIFSFSLFLFFVFILFLTMDHFFSHHLYDGLMDVKPASLKDEGKIKMESEAGEFKLEFKNFTGCIVFTETSKILESSTESDNLGIGSGLRKHVMKDSPGSTPAKIKKELVKADADAKGGHRIELEDEPESPTVWDVNDADCNGASTGKKNKARFSMMSFDSVPYKGGRESVLSTFSDELPPKNKEDDIESDIDSELDDEFGETQQEQFNF